LKRVFGDDSEQFGFRAIDYGKQFAGTIFELEHARFLARHFLADMLQTEPHKWEDDERCAREIKRRLSILSKKYSDISTITPTSEINIPSLAALTLYAETNPRLSFRRRIKEIEENRKRMASMKKYFAKAETPAGFTLSPSFVDEQMEITMHPEAIVWLILKKGEEPVATMGVNFHTQPNGVHMVIRNIQGRLGKQRELEDFEKLAREKWNVFLGKHAIQYAKSFGIAEVHGGQPFMPTRQLEMSYRKKYQEIGLNEERIGQDSKYSLITRRSGLGAMLRRLFQ